MGLFIEKIQKAERIYVTHRELSFDYVGETNWGFAFELDENGNLDFEALELPAQENLLACFSEDNPLGVEYKGINEWEHSYWQSAIGICKHCGAEVYLSDPMDNDCECGAIYNMSGQEVRCHARDVDYLDAGEVW